MINTRKVIAVSALTALAAFILIIVLLGLKISSLSDQLDENNQLYSRELENNKILIDELSQNIQIIASGGNEVRRSLNLPEKRLIQKSSGNVEETQIDPAVTFFDAFRFLVSNDANESSAAVFSLFLTENNIEEYFVDNGYQFQRDDFQNASVLMEDKTYLSAAYNNEKKIIAFSDILGNSFEVSINDENFTPVLDKEIELLSAFQEEITERESYMDELMNRQEIAEILEERSFSIEKENPDKFNIINNKDKSVVGYYGRKDRNLVLNNEEIAVETEFESAFINFLGNVSNLTEYEKIDNLVLEKMESVFADEGFKLLLESNECKNELLRREDEEFVYFDIYNNNGSVKGSFLLQKEFGEVLLLTGDGKYLKSLKMFSPGNDFRSLIIEEKNREAASPYAFDDSSETFLIVGTHEHNADTMIIVNANNRTGKIKMISFPRDLYYKGKKINNIYKVYGPVKLCEALSEITGLNINKYVSIDMFAFIDVVNILGGIDVTLEEDLIDPTYKVKNNGIWSTLHYRKGTHNLDGVSALRVARSRHGSEAYDRSKRQQLIIKAVLDTMISLDGGDIGKMYEFVTSVFSYIDTNMTIADLVKDFLMYKDNEIEDPNVINTDNILDAEWSNAYLLPEEEKMVVERDPQRRGLWIVLPRNNDWDLFKRHVESILN